MPFMERKRRPGGGKEIVSKEFSFSSESCLCIIQCIYNLHVCSKNSIFIPGSDNRITTTAEEIKEVLAIGSEYKQGIFFNWIMNDFVVKETMQKNEEEKVQRQRRFLERKRGSNVVRFRVATTLWLMLLMKLGKSINLQKLQEMAKKAMQSKEVLSDNFSLSDSGKEFAKIVQWIPL